MPKWTTDQNRFLFENALLGSKKLAKLMLKEFGVSRKPSAVRRQMYRIGLKDLKHPLEICPMCGKYAQVMTKNGLCRVCNYKKLIEQQYRYRESIEREFGNKK